MGVVTSWVRRGRGDLEAVTSRGKQPVREAKGAMLLWAGPRHLCFPREPASASLPFCQARAASQEEKRVSLSCMFGARLCPRVFRGPAASQFPPRPAPFTCEGSVQSSLVLQLLCSFPNKKCDYI